MQDEIEVLIADDHPVFITGLKQIIEKAARMKVVAQEHDGKHALDRIRELRPHVAVLDMHMPELSGLAVAKEVLSESLRTRCVILTAYDDTDLFADAMESGILGYVLKDSAATDIVRCIDAVARGEHHVSPTFTNSILGMQPAARNALESLHGLDRLTSQERRILRLVARDKTTAEIAAFLSLSPRTIDHHRSNICQKLGLSGINALLRFALQHKTQI